MVCDNCNIPELKIETIVNELGNFENEKIVLKKYARIGQGFSTTKFIDEIP